MMFLNNLSTFLTVGKRYFFSAFLGGILLLLGCEKYNGPDYSDDGLPPAVPVNIQTYYSGESIVALVWSNNKEHDLSGYYIYKKMNDNFFRIDTVYENYFFESGLAYDSTYVYSISAFDSRGRLSALSKEYAVTSPNKLAPAVPRQFVVYGNNAGSVPYYHLQWVAPPDYDIQRYIIYRDTLMPFSPDSTKIIGTVSALFFRDSLPSTTKKFYYSIVAVDKGGLSGSPTPIKSDLILEKPILTSPAPNIILPRGTPVKFSVGTVSVLYKVTVSTTEYGDELWQSELFTGSGNQFVYLPEYLLNRGRMYYWRVYLYTLPPVPNAVSVQSSFRYDA